MDARRRQLMIGAAALALAPEARAQIDTPWAGDKVIDCHHHVRADLAVNSAHVTGAGMTSAMPNAAVLEGDGSAARAIARQLCRAQPDRFAGWLTSLVPTIAGEDARLTSDIRSGAKGFGEIKAKVAMDGPEMRRVYALAGELDVPVLIHFDSDYDTGFERIEPVLKAFPATRFVAHANAFWGNIDARYDGSPYPRGKITAGGLSDRLLTDYGNLFGDLSAYSGFNGLTRDPAFTPAFLERHQDKLIFGSDCPCTDGRGAGARGCQARQTLGVLKANAADGVFRKMVWTNAHRVYRLS